MQDEETTEELRAKLAEGHALVRMQDDQIQRIALERKRDPEQVLAAALAEVRLAPEVAVKNYYSIPYKEGGESDKTTDVEGLSVRAAETLARLWGNCAVSGSLLEEQDDRAVCVGTFLDYEGAFIRRETVRVSRIQHRRRGGDTRLGARQWATEIAKGCSIAARNATLRALPQALKARYWAGVRAIIAETEGPKLDGNAGAADRKSKLVAWWAAVVAQFVALGVTREQLEQYLGHATDGSRAPTEEQVASLRGLRNAIEQGEVEVADVFAHLTHKVETQDGVGGLGGTATVTKGATDSSFEKKPTNAPALDHDAGAEEPAKVAGESGSPASEAKATDPLPATSTSSDESPWDARGCCRVCRRHRKFIEHQGHGTDDAGARCSYAS